MSIDIEWLILADGAQVVNGKLFLIGGGWELIMLGSTRFPIRHHCAIAAAYRVPWADTNRQVAMEIEVAHEDGETLVSVASHFEVGRSPGVLPGQDQRVQIATDFALEFSRPGTYVVIGRIEGEEKRRAPFAAVVNPLLATQQPPPPLVSRNKAH